jgi:TRAP-type C4-dicarboxylate transport system substrate-binding protein
MKKRITQLIAIFFLLAVTVSLLNPVLPYAEEKKVWKKAEIDLKMPTIAAPGSKAFARMDEWPGQMIEKASHGRIKVTHYPGGTLVPGPDMYRALQLGIADFAWIFGAMNPGAFPLYDLFSLPGLFPNMATSNLVLSILRNKFPEFEKQFSPKVKHISSSVMLRSQIHSTVPIRTLADLKGKVIGCHDETSAKAMSKLGASALVLPLGEMYTSGERGVVQGLVVAWGAFGNFRLNEVYKYHTLVPISPTVSHYLFSSKIWNKFTSEEQEKFELMGPWFQRACNEGANLPGYKILKEEILAQKKGHELFEWSPKDMIEVRKMFRSLWVEWAEKMEKKGLPGKKILEEAERLLELYGYQFG